MQRLRDETSDRDYQESLTQAACYGKELRLREITLVFFVESIDEKNREKYEVAYVDEDTGVIVHPVFVQLGCKVSCVNRKMS